MDLPWKCKKMSGEGTPLPTPFDACGASTLAQRLAPQMQFLDPPLYLAKIGRLHRSPHLYLFEEKFMLQCKMDNVQQKNITGSKCQ